MLFIPQKGIVKAIRNDGIVGAALPATAIVSNAVSLVPGAVTEFISAANNIQDSWGIFIGIHADVDPSATATETLLDIVTGGVTDDVLIPSLICGGASRSFSRNYFFPLHIPQGKRIAGILTSVKVSMAYHVLIILYGGSPPPWRVGRKVTAYGTKINNARGQAVVPSVSGAAASITQLTASTTDDHFAFLPGFQSSTDSTINTAGINIGIGVGASVEDRIGTWWIKTFSTEEQLGPIPCFPAIQDVPSGSRLTMLASNSLATNDGAYDGLIYAVS